MIFLWMFSGSFIYNNLIGICITLCCIATIRIENLKVVVVIFSLLFVYDIFWVFFSELFFQQNVMVTVANQNFTQPAVKGRYLFRFASLRFSCVVMETLGRNVSSTYNLEFPVCMIMMTMIIWTILHCMYNGMMYRPNSSFPRGQTTLSIIWDWAISFFLVYFSVSSSFTNTPSIICRIGMSILLPRLVLNPTPLPFTLA